ncbi:MAG: dihydrodipicolinate synthase family protein [Nitrospinota bacterium]|nr:MAG: dihydrodipicolinate synthase family protein [Nitrospinota bacterium]
MQLRGIIPPMTTPFDEKGEVDEEAFREEVRYLLAAGVHGLAVGGSTGEGHTLTLDEARRLTAIAVEEVKGQIPVVAGIIADSTRAVIERGKAVQDLGVAALQITPVHYLFPPNEEEMYRYYATIGDAVGLPILIYNVVPWAYASPALLTRIITEVEPVIGVKQSAGDMHALAELLLRLEERGLVFAAVDDLLYPCFALGSHGAIAAILTAVPQLSVALWKAVEEGKHTEAQALHRRLFQIWMALRGPNLPARVKAAMELQGQRAGWPRAPMQPASEEERTRIREALQASNLL